MEGQLNPDAKRYLEQLAQKYRLVVFTARENIEPVRQFLKENGLLDLFSDITNVKPKDAVAFIDDRNAGFKQWDDELLQQIDANVHRFREGDTPSTTKQDKDSTAPHLHDTILHDLAHTMRHIKRIMEPDAKGSEQSTQFNAEHALHHAESAQEHAKKLDAHLSENPSNPKTWKSERDMLQQMREIGDYPLGTILDHR